jgi:CheY-like chemotaxis protein
MATIAIAEDEAPIRDLLAVILRREGYTVVVATDGPGAIALITETQPDLALIDVMMPGLDGPDVARRLRAAPGTAQIPVILTSAAPPTHLPDDAIAFLRKPFDVANLLEVVATALAARG